VLPFQTSTTGVPLLRAVTKHVVELGHDGPSMFGTSVTPPLEGRVAAAHVPPLFVVSYSALLSGAKQVEAVAQPTPLKDLPVIPEARCGVQLTPSVVVKSMALVPSSALPTAIHVFAPTQLTPVMLGS
jgi:hypothetical protein